MNDPRVAIMHLCVAGLTLIQGLWNATQDEVDRLLDSLLEIAISSHSLPIGSNIALSRIYADVRRGIEYLYRHLSERGDCLYPISPDLLGEQIAGTVIEQVPALTSLVLDKLPRFAGDVFTTLNRTRRLIHGRDFRAALDEALALALVPAGKLCTFAPALIRGCASADGELENAVIPIAQCVSNKDVVALIFALPHTSVRFAALRAATSARMEVDDDVLNKSPEETAVRVLSAMQFLASSPMTDGEIREGVTKTQEIVTMLNKLTTIRPSKFEGELEDAKVAYGRLTANTAAVDALITAQSALGLAETSGGLDEAIRRTDIAIQTLTQLNSKEEGEYAHELATALSNYSRMLLRARRPDEALSASRGAMNLLGKLLANKGVEALPACAATLDVVAKLQSYFGKGGDAVMTMELAVRVQKAALENGIGRVPGLAMMLHNQAVALMDQERRVEDTGEHIDVEKILSVNSEALDMYRGLIEADRDANLAAYAAAAATQGAVLWTMERFDESLLATEEALSLRREMARKIQMSSRTIWPSHC